MIDKLIRKKSLIFIALYDSKPLSKTEVAKKTELTYSYVDNVINEFEKIGMLTIELADGRTTAIKLTKKGKEIAKHLIDLVNLFK